ncbi:MAG: ATP-binding protein, partial [Planctomycetes bacterium]|nr:ATP-binding protein [Planctomycetota bacterium]
MQLISRSGQRSVFVGRSLEFSALTEAFNSMLDGSGATVVVSGDAGMGKTTLVEHFAESARKRGAQVH